METARLLFDLVCAGWSLQIVPEETPFGAVFATLIWTLKRDEMDTLLDGAGAVPVEEHVHLADPANFDVHVRAFHARVFPISPYGDLPGDSPFWDLDL